MKRDMDLIRKILLIVEESKSSNVIEGYTQDEIKYHQSLIIEADLAKGRVLPDFSSPTNIPAVVNISGLTWKGHDFIEAISSDTNWQKVKDFLKDAGKQITIETIKAATISLFGFQ